MAVNRRISRRPKKHFALFLALIFTTIIVSFYWKDKNITFVCKPPNLNPFDSSIKHLVKDPDFSGCTHPLLFSSTFSSLVTLSDLKSGNGIKSCCYRVLTRGNSTEKVDDSYSLSDECYPVGVNKSETVIQNGTEFIVISCERQDGSEKKMDMHPFVHEKPEVEKRIRKYYEKQKVAGQGLREEDKVNVVIFGTDSVSQQEFQRSFSKTYKYLKEELSAYEMRGRNAISDGTYPNLIPFLSGLDSKTLEWRCYKHKFYDTCPFIWKRYGENGYRTIYGEDGPAGLGTFNYGANGFKKPPTDYYFRPFSVGADVLIGNSANPKLRNNNICYGPRLSFEVLLDYMKKIAHVMGHEKRYFQWLWDVYLTHDAINYGRLGDKMLQKTLKWFKHGGNLNKTILILLSDHGMRYGEIREYPQGMFEERLPYLFFVVPHWFEKKYPAACKNLKNNQDKLTTTFDLHETLLDLLHLDGLKDSAIARKNQSLLTGNLPRGISHFLPIPSWRTCELAAIPEHYCTCHSLKALSSSEPIAKEAANFVVLVINAMLIEYKKCATLSLGMIRSVYKIDYVVATKKLRDGEEGYKLSIETLPGQATFEATVLRQVRGLWTMSGTISRTNSYGNQSHCVDVKALKLYCYCFK